MTTKTQCFGQLIEADDILIRPGIYRGCSASLAQQITNIGFGIHSRPIVPLLRAREAQDFGVAVESIPG
jgi:hypothetical protein